jgi:hypothetical protein
MTSPDIEPFEEDGGNSIGKVDKQVGVSVNEVERVRVDEWVPRLGATITS